MIYKINKKGIYNDIYNYTKKEFPNESDEFCKLIAKQRTDDEIRNKLIEYISDKLYQTGCYSIRETNARATNIMKDLPVKLFPNIEEWLNDEPLSEIKYGNMSIKRLVDFDMGHNFLYCVRIMLRYIKSGCKYEETCYWSFVHD